MSKTNKNILLWEKKAKSELDSDNLDSLRHRSLEDIEIKAFYTKNDVHLNEEEEIPGIYPFTRGVRATMYKNRPWTIRQYAGFSTARETNEFYKECLKGGQKGLSVAFDLPTHRGYDSDDPLVYADVGQAGVAISSVEDMKVLFADIPLDKVSVSMTMNGAVLPILAAFIVCALENGVKKEQLSGTIQNDILKEFMVRNTFIYPPKESMHIVADIIEYTAKYMPKFNSVSISGYHIHEAGASLSLELALTLGNGLEYVKSALKRGLLIDDFAPRLSFFFATGMNFFMEIAKLRAARKLWAEMMKDLGCKNEASLLLRTHCQTSGWSLSAKDPYNNIVRTTIEALASALGGTQSLHTNSFDEALALPTQFSARIARNTQLILQHETKICEVVDPMGGSYYVEYLTKELIDKAKTIILSIGEGGGMVKAIENGLPMKWIDEESAKRQAIIDSKEEIIVGQNAYHIEDDEEPQILSVDSSLVVMNQKRSLEELKRHRSSEKVKKSLDAISEAAQNKNGNLLALCVEAMSLRATVGEVSLALEKVYGRYKPTMSISTGIYKSMHKDPAKVNEIINEVSLFAKKIGRQPRILVAKLGQDGHNRGAKIIASAFADFGFDVDLSPLFQSPKSIVEEAIDNDVHVIGISSLAGGHKTLVPLLMQELKLRNCEDILVVVGGVIPKKDHKALFDCGVLEIFGPGTDIIFGAKKILARLSSKI